MTPYDFPFPQNVGPKCTPLLVIFRISNSHRLFPQWIHFMAYRIFGVGGSNDMTYDMTQDIDKSRAM